MRKIILVLLLIVAWCWWSSNQTVTFGNYEVEIDERFMQIPASQAENNYTDNTIIDAWVLPTND